MGCISTHTTRQGGDLRTEATRQGGTLDISVSLVCSVNLQEPYIRVSPDFVWLTESNLWTAVMQVESNRPWRVE